MTAVDSLPPSRAGTRRTSPPRDPDLASLATHETRTQGRTPWTGLAVIAGLAALAVQIALVWNGRHPTFPYDEVSMLQMARFMAGEDVPELRGGGYFPGWSVAMIPLAWITSDPAMFYQFSLVLGVILAMATAWPLAQLVRRTGASAAQSTFAAFVVLTLPAHAVQAAFTLSEQLLLFVLSCLAVAVWRLAERGDLLSAAIVGLLAAATYFTHLRALVIVIATAVWLLLFIRQRWRAALVGLAFLVLGYLASDWAGNAVNSALRGGAATQSEGFLENLESTGPFLVARSRQLRHGPR